MGLHAMAKVTFNNPEDAETHTIEVPVGTTLLEAAQEAGAKMGYACGGVCACSTCHSWVEAGMNLLSEQEDKEMDRLDQAFDVKSISRLGCQSIIEREGEIRVQITEESLQAYYDEHPIERRKREEERLLKASTAPGPDRSAS
jgi:2Fe-2S ferredoxin